MTEQTFQALDRRALLASAGQLSASGAFAQPSRTPNIAFILCDDLG